MKKYLFSLILFLLLSSIAEAVEIGTSVPSGSQYVLGREYKFYINISNVTGGSTVTFEWNGLENRTTNLPVDLNYVSVTESLEDLAAGSYSYRWIFNNTTNVLIFPSTYEILKNSSVSITLTLDGTAGDKSYNQYDVANFVVNLNIPGKTVKLDSTYPNWTTITNTSLIYNSTNLTASGLFSLTASWDGDQNYTSSSRTYYFDTGPPQFSGTTSIPNSPTGYIPNTEYKLQVTCKDATLADVWFESNHTGTMERYYSYSDTPVQNSSGVFWVILKDLSAKKFSYRWHAKDDLNDESSTDFINYEILKMSPLVMDILPSTNIREGTQITATCYSINPLEIPVSKFNFYKDSNLIENISSSTRMDTFLLSTGTYNFTCNTSGTQNYSSQSLTRNITVLSAPPEENVTGEFKISDVNFPSIKTGESGEASFNLVNEMLKNIFNITIDLSGISSEWYSITSKPSYIYSGETKEVKISLSIPSDAEAKTYSISINVKGNTSDRKIITSTKILNMKVIGITQNMPPSLFMGSINTTVAGAEAIFSLQWSDDNDLSGYVFSSNSSGAWENDSWVPLTGKSGWINVTKKLNSSVGSIVAWKIYANDSDNKWSISDEYFVKITAAATSLDIFFIITILIVIVVVIFVIVFIRKRKATEEVEYVYRRGDIENEEKT